MESERSAEEKFVKDKSITMNVFNKQNNRTFFAVSENRIKIGLSTHRSFTPFPLSKCKSVLSSSLFSVKQLFEREEKQSRVEG